MSNIRMCPLCNRVKRDMEFRGNHGIHACNDYYIDLTVQNMIGVDDPLTRPKEGTEDDSRYQDR